MFRGESMLDINMLCRIVIPRVVHIMGCLVAAYYGLPSVVCQPC